MSDLSSIFTNYNLAVAACKRFFASVPFSAFGDRLENEVFEDLLNILELASDMIQS